MYMSGQEKQKRCYKEQKHAFSIFRMTILKESWADYVAHWQSTCLALITKCSGLGDNGPHRFWDLTTGTHEVVPSGEASPC